MSALRKNIDRCAGFSFPKRTHSAILPPAPQPGVPGSTRAATPAPLSLLSSLTWGENGTETYVGEPVGRIVEAAVGRPAVDRVGVTTAAPIHTVRA